MRPNGLSRMGFGDDADLLARESLGCRSQNREVSIGRRTQPSCTQVSPPTAERDRKASSVLPKAIPESQSVVVRDDPLVVVVKAGRAWLC